MKVTVLTVQKGCRAVAKAAVENCVQTRGQGCSCQHHITHQPSGVARGHDIQYSEWEVRVSHLGGPSQRSDNGSPHVHSGQYR